MRLALPAVVPSAATLIIVVCVGFLVLMVVLGLVRIHSLHRRVSGAGGPPGGSSDPKDPDLFWDDSALTIIVNPMEVRGGGGAGRVGSVGAQLGRTASMRTPAELPLSLPSPVLPGPADLHGGRCGQPAGGRGQQRLRGSRLAQQRRETHHRDPPSPLLRPPPLPRQREDSALVRQTPPRRERRTR